METVTESAQTAAAGERTDEFEGRVVAASWTLSYDVSISMWDARGRGDVQPVSDELASACVQVHTKLS